MENCKTQNSQNNLQENNVRLLTIPNFKTYCKAMVIRQCVTGKRTEMWMNGLDENLEINCLIYSQLIVDNDQR